MKKNNIKQRTPVVVHLVTALDFGGVERRMEVLARNRSYSRRPMIFCAIGHDGATGRRLRQLGVEVLCLQEPVKIPSIGAIIALLRLFVKIRPEVVHTHGAEANFHGLIAAWLARVPVRIGEEIGTPNHSQLGKIVFRFVYRFARAVIGGSKPVTDWLIESKEVPKGKVTKVFNPLDLPTLKVGRVSKSPIRFGYVGRLEPVKNPEMLVEAIWRIHSEGIYAPELWIIGDGSQRQMLEGYIEKVDLQLFVTFYGYQEQPFDILRECDVLVQPSYTEGFSNALVEAMGCGLPVLVTDTGAASEIVQDGVSGWIIPSGDLDAITKALINICGHDRENLLRMGRVARASVEGRFEPMIYIKTLDSIYTIESDILL